MEKIIYFADYATELKNLIIKSNNEYKFIDDAIETLIHYNVRYNTTNGKTLDSSGVICSYNTDFPKHKDIEDVFIYEFLPLLKNECKRIDFFKKQGKNYFY